MMNKILIIDDEAILCNAISKKLNKLGFQATCATSAIEGMELALSGTYDLVLLDLVMPDLSGIELLTGVRKTVSKTKLPIIVVSSREGSADIVEALKCGANDYVTKPIVFDILCARIETQLEVKAMADSAAKEQALGALAAMVTTYNHEINNPLATAMALLHRAHKKHNLPDDIHDRMDHSLMRIRDIVKKIDKTIEDGKIDFESYVGETKMLKIG